MKHFTVGQQLYCVPSDSRYFEPRYVTIDKVGRTLLHFKKDDFATPCDMSTMCGKDWPHEKFFMSKEEYEHVKACDNARYILHHRPYTIEEIVKVVAVLGYDTVEDFVKAEWK